MKIVIAPDKFKGSLGAKEVADAIAAGLRSIDPEIDLDACPLADGGEGTVAALVEATRGRIETRTVTGPLPGMRVEAPIGLLGDGETAVVEMSSASGLHLLAPDKRNPMRTTTFGTGELLRAAADLGVRRIILGIGGSATVDAGIGCVQGYGGKVTLSNGTVYSRGDRVLVGSDVSRVAGIEVGTRRLTQTTRRARERIARSLPSAAPGLGVAGRVDPSGPEIVVATDVGNPLCGPNGAAAIFGPQKGATPEQIEQLDTALSRLAQRTAPELADAAGAGAAGGLGFGLMAFFGAAVRSGIEIVTEAARFRQRLAGADLCITGEGRFDLQSLAGKTAIGAARLCREVGVPCIVVAGSIGEEIDPSYDEGVTAIFCICDGPITLDDAISRAPELLARLAGDILRAVRLDQSKRPSARQ